MIHHGACSVSFGVLWRWAIRPCISGKLQKYSNASNGLIWHAGHTSSPVATFLPSWYCLFWQKQPQAPCKPQRSAERVLGAFAATTTPLVLDHMTVRKPVPDHHNSERSASDLR